MALIGYGRVSTGGQSTDTQSAALRAAGCERIFTETASGAKRERPQLRACIEYMRAGDTLVVLKLDRLARSVLQLHEIIGELQSRGIGFKCTSQAVDISGPTGKLVFAMLAAIAEFERALICERTREGLATAHAAGRRGGRPPTLTPQKWSAVQAAIRGGASVAEAARLAGVSRAAVYQKVKRAGGRGAVADGTP
jgi:DNA invertase Pin-like site-specific DNA recombinase